MFNENQPVHGRIDSSACTMCSAAIPIAKAILNV